MAHELGVIGAGNMAEAIVRSLLTSGRLRADKMIADDVAPARRQLFEEQLKVRAASDNATAARDAKMILLSVKPQHMKDVLHGLGSVLSADTLVISIAAGISSASIEKN